MLRQKMTRYRRTMLFWTFFQGIGATFGGTMGMLYPYGEFYGGQSMVASVQKVGLDSMFLPSFGLFALIGIGNLIAAALIMRGRRVGMLLGCVEGLVISGFTAAEIAILGNNPISDIYCVLGAAQFVCGLLNLKAVDASRFDDSTGDV